LAKVTDKEIQTKLLFIEVSKEDADIKMIKKYLSNGVDVNAKDKLGRTAKDYAKENTNPEIIKILSENEQ